jgi:hypothetical protein
MMRSMTESILPALDPADSLAQEQAKLMMGHIHALMEQQGHEHTVLAHEQQHLATLAEHLVAIAEGGEQTQAALAQVNAGLAEGDSQQLSLATEALVAATDASPSFKQQAWLMVLEYGSAAAARGKAWFEPMGF